MLLEHNLPVYQELCETLEKYRKAIVVVHTGGGKSYIANEFLTEKKLNALVVCPKRTICDQWRELNPEVTAVTYNYFSRAPMEELLSYECVVLDEAHHCGSPVWGKRTKEFMDATTGYVIGLTADSRRWSDGVKDVANDVFDGHLVKGPDLEDAIEQKTIQEPLYVYTVIGLKEDAKNLEEKYTQLKKEKKIPSTQYQRVDHALHQLKLDVESIPSVQDTLKKYMPQKPKGIVFVDNIAATDEAYALMTDAFPDLPTYIVHTKQPNSTNQEQMAAFAADESACIISVDMLGEGIHVGGVNFVVMLRRTQSPTVFFQQLGRTTVVNGTETPVIIDVVGNSCTLKGIETRESNTLGLFKRDTGKKGGQIIVEAHVISAYRMMNRVKEALAQYRPWTQAEDDLLTEKYPIEGGDAYKHLQNRTKNACQKRAQFLGLRCEINNWTKEEIIILSEFYGTEGPRVVERLQRHSLNCCKMMASKLGLTFRGHRKNWNNEEISILTSFYPAEGMNVAKRLPGRTKDACEWKARNLGIVFLGICGEKVARWTKNEINIMKMYYPTEGITIQNRLPNRTRAAIFEKARQLNLKVGA